MSAKNTGFTPCKFCNCHVNLDDEGNSYADGTQAHEECADSANFQDANESDFRD